MIFFDTKDLKDDEIYLSLTNTYEANPKKKWVPSYNFEICLIDTTKIGYCNLRIDNTELTQYCGNIGYGIDEQYRGKHYSCKAAKLLLKLAKKHNLKYVRVTCEPNNIASNKICKLLNAELIETITIPKEQERFFEGMKKLSIYQIDLQNIK